MELNKYQGEAREFAIYPPQSPAVVYPMLGLCGETGELSDHVKKSIRDDGGVITPDREAKMRKEAGDILWYLSSFCSDMGWSLSEIAVENIQKLQLRKEREALQGSGDDR